MRGYKQCPVCKGTGVVVEDSSEFLFVTRDPATNKCLICNGKGAIPCRQKMPEPKPPQKEARLRLVQQLPPAEAKPILPDSPPPPASKPPKLSELYPQLGAPQAGGVTAELILRGPAEDIIKLLQNYKIGASQ